MKINKWWVLLVGLIISIIVGFLTGVYTERENLVVKNLIGLAIILVCFVIGWYCEKPEEKEDKKKKEL